MGHDSDTLPSQPETKLSIDSRPDVSVGEPDPSCHPTMAVPSGQDLRGARLSGRDLAGVDLSGSDLSNADLLGANLAGANLSGTTLHNAQFLGANLAGADLSECEAVGAEFGGGVNFSRAILFGSNLKGATLSRSTLDHADLRAVCLQEARLCDVDLTDADLCRADLRGADLTNASVARARFGECDLRCSRLSAIGGYVEADWIGADVRDADFRGGYLARRTIADQNYLHEFRNYSRGNSIVYWIWWATSDCGRSISRWAGCIGLIILVFAAAFEIVEVDWGNHPTALSSVYYSVVTFTTLGYGDVLPVSAPGQLVAIAEVFLGYVMLGGLLSIFANKMARRAD